MNYSIPKQSITNSTVTIEGNTISYQAITGTLVLRNNNNIPTISMSYTAYFKKGEDVNTRPITFLYNGGPGSATLWLHMGAFGPQRVFIKDTTIAQPPYKTINNDYSLLDASDLVFIDAPGTGYGTIITKEMGGAGSPQMFYGIDQDGNAFKQFIKQFIIEHDRWTSPKYIFGESYGTFRSAVLANKLLADNINLNGVILLSQILSYSNVTEVVNTGNDLPFQLILPSYTATAWYHHKLPNQPATLEPLLKEVENFAMNDYALALNKGAELDEATLNSIAQRLHNYTGLPIAYLIKARLRVTGPQFEQELLGQTDSVVGRLDSRFKGPALNPMSAYAQYDPMFSAIGGAYVANLYHYMNSDLKFGKNMEYKTFADIKKWNIDRGEEVSFSNVMGDLANAMISNPKMKVMLNQGYFDLGTPYFEGIYEMKHLPMPNSLQNNITYFQYQCGHMVYLQEASLKALHDNVAKFINATH